MRSITKKDIDAIRKPSVFDLGKNILYDMCRDHPGHSKDEEIVAKVWLIGRSHAAAIERRRNANIGEDFYKTRVVPAMRNKRIDSWLGSIKQTEKSGSTETVEIHKKLMVMFHSITDLDKRSLASKYLHFHKPDAFFIYDSRARQSISKVVPPLNKIPELKTKKCDPEYRDFVRRCVWLRDEVQKNFGTELTPWEIDKLLLKITDEIRSSKYKR
ncbi:MAG: hypothetical protein V1766_09535 [Pseudomonadota bacterium]